MGLVGGIAHERHDRHAERRVGGEALPKVRLVLRVVLEEEVRLVEDDVRRDARAVRRAVGEHKLHLNAPVFTHPQA